MFLIDSQDFSIPMALIDLIPVILFFISGIILLNDLYNKLVKGNYAMLATGVCMVFNPSFFRSQCFGNISRKSRT